MELATRCLLVSPPPPLLLLLLASLGAASAATDWDAAIAADEPSYYDEAMMSPPEAIDYKDPCKAGLCDYSEKKTISPFHVPAVPQGADGKVLEERPCRGGG
ncbi:hypothetical protein C0J50_18466 [Silurus asotus]|uniref:Uncharacterized protein n=1 Tax=Silurus asotus TaxID=30991 RepID=A0AAD5ATH9_SILAS|nr:hypothetical protein C0J50_18466 [Silurus asotus]